MADELDGYDDNPGGDLSDLALSPAHGADQTVFVAADHPGHRAVYRSTDGGGTWTVQMAAR